MPVPSTIIGFRLTSVGTSYSLVRFDTAFIIGTGPMAYLTDWRMQRALQMLDDGRCSVQQVAARTGYRSPAAFSRAFAGKFGHPPSEHRRMAS